MILPEPLGALFLLVAIAATLVVGIVIVITGWKSKKRRLVGFGVIAAPWVMLMFLAPLSLGIDDWNPMPKSDADAWGTWAGDGNQVVLQANGDFTATLKNETVAGAWNRFDWNIFLTEENGTKRTMRFVKDSGELLLLTDPPSDGSFRPGPIAKKQKL